MTTTPTLQFWFAVGSTYTYLSAMRIRALCEPLQIPLTWHPFNIREIMLETDNLPFPDTKPAKRDYMWRDLKRRTQRYDLPLQEPVTYPLPDYERANRIAAFAETEAWCESFVIESYRHWMQQGLPAGSDANLEATLSILGQDSSRVLNDAALERGKAQLDTNTQMARSLGVFGAPSFVVGKELFWGDDRLEDAIDWAQAVTIQ